MADGIDETALDEFGNVGTGMQQEKWIHVVLNDTLELRIAQVPGGRQEFLHLMRTETEVNERTLEIFNGGDSVWPSATILSRWLAMHPHPVLDLRGKTVLELGSGVGLAGVTTALLGAEQVLLQDRMEIALREVMNTAVELNVSSKTMTLCCDWKELPSRLNNASEASLQAFARPDVIIASEVLYEDHLARLVAETLGMLLKEPGQVAYIVDPYKRRSRRLFRKLCKEQGLEVDENEIVTWEPEWDDHLETEAEWACVLLTVRAPS